MGVPKRRHSRERSALRRQHQRLTPVQLVACPRCNQPRRPHRVCQSCGYLAGREILKPKEA